MAHRVEDLGGRQLGRRGANGLERRRKGKAGLQRFGLVVREGGAEPVIVPRRQPGDLSEREAVARVGDPAQRGE